MIDRPDPASAVTSNVRLPGLGEIILRSSWLALGEGSTRLANFLVVILVVATRGPEGLGVFAIGQLIGTYLMLGTDFGFKTAGVRFVSLRRTWVRPIVHAIQRRRALLGAIVFPAGLFYAFAGPVPDEARLFVAGFALSVLPQAFTLDWALLGMERFAWLGLLRTGVALTFAAGSGVWLWAGGGLGGVAIVNGASTLLGALAVWFLWFRSEGAAASVDVPDEARSEIVRQTAFRSVAWLGLATIGVQVLQSVDTLLLGGLVPVEEVGRYNGAHKLVVLVFGAYYLFTQAALPSLSRMGEDEASIQHVRRWVVRLAAGGIACGAIVALVADPVIRVVYGASMAEAAGALRWLAATIPLEFALAFMGTALVAWKRERLMLALAMAGVALNVGLNLAVIPSSGMIGAAHAKIVSYLVVDVLAWMAISGSPVFRRLSDRLDSWGMNS